MTLVILFVLGVLVGSFLNVCGLRFNSGLTLSGRSFCFACQKKLHWWELVPMISFLGLRGKCSKCKTPISWQYPLVELWTGLLFVTIFNFQLSVFKEINLLFWIAYFLIQAVFCIYVVITIYDARHKIIPDSLSYAAIILAVIYRLLISNSTFIIPNPFLDWLAGPILFGFFGLLWLLTRGRAMGLGDAKLALSVGVLLGAAQGFSAIVLAFWIGTVVALIWMIFSRKRITMKSEIPFGPFIIVGAWLAMVLKLDILHVLLFTNY